MCVTVQRSGYAFVKVRLSNHIIVVSFSLNIEFECSKDTHENCFFDYSQHMFQLRTRYVILFITHVSLSGGLSIVATS